MPTTPGFHTAVDSTIYPEQVRAAIRGIARQFYVTRSFRSVEIGNSRYWAVLARPNDDFAVYINTDREVLILFSEYNTFEIRTLDAYAEFYDLLESTRIDKSVRFLISADDNIEAKIRHYLDQNPEYPIIVPLTYTRVLVANNSSMLDAVRRNYLLRDLFGYQNPLREETFFFGRQNIVKNVLDQAKSGQNSSLFGLRKSGKTSVIVAIQRKAKSMSCSVAVIDCENPAVHSRRFGALLSYIVSEVRKTLGQKKINVNLGDALSEISENFFSHMNNSIAQSKTHLLLIFDEIENISPKTAASAHWREGDDTLYFWQVIRSYVQNESKGRLSLCLIGTSPRILETPKINDVSNPVYLFAQKQFIPNLTIEETTEMVRRLGYFMGLEFPLETIAELQREFGGHPFFTRQVCSRIHHLLPTNRPIQVSKITLRRAIEEFQGTLESYLRNIINQLRDDYSDEFDLLCRVVAGERHEITEYGTIAPELIDHLIGYGLVKKIGEDFDIYLESVRRALKNIGVLSSNEERWSEISARRNKLEVAIRVELFHWSKGVSPDEWNNILSESMTGCRFDKLLSLEPKNLFSSNSSPLYLSDLFMLIKDHRVLPYLSGRRSKIVEQLDVINKLRKDAHALVVSDDDIARARGVRLS